MAINYTSDFSGQHNDDYDARISALLNTIQEQQQTILTQQQSITTLTNRLTTLESNYSTLNSLPHVIECGGTGITTASGYWQKWNTGLKEWWAIVSTTQSPYYTQSGTNYSGYSNIINFPSGLFTSSPHVWYSAHCGSGFCLTGTILGENCTKDRVSLYLLSSASGNQTIYWRVYAAGV